MHIQLQVQKQGKNLGLSEMVAKPSSGSMKCIDCLVFELSNSLRFSAYLIDF